MNKEDKERKNMLNEVVSITRNTEYDFIGKRSGIGPAIDIVVEDYMKGLEAETKQGIPTHGETLNLGNKFHALSGIGFRLCSSASAYYGIIGEVENKGKVNFTLNQIEEHHLNGIGAFMDGILLTITPAIAALLAPYGGSVAVRDDVVLKLLQFRDVDASTDIARDARKENTSAIHPFIMKSIKSLEDLVDPIVNTMIDEYPELHGIYFNGRKIHHFPHGTTIAEGYMVDPEGNPIFDGQVYFGTQNITLHTFLDGSFSKPHFPHGIAAPVASHPLYRPNPAAPYEIKQGKTVSHIFHMVLL